jgi:hypothetical protein
MINIILTLVSMILLIKYWSPNFSSNNLKDSHWNSEKPLPKSQCTGDDLVDPYSANMGQGNKGKPKVDQFPNLLGDIFGALAGSGEFEVTEVDDLKVGDYLVDLRVETDLDSQEKKVIVKKFSKLEDGLGDF